MTVTFGSENVNVLFNDTLLVLIEHLDLKLKQIFSCTCAVNTDVDMCL